MVYEEWAIVRLLLKFLSVDIVSLMVVKFPGDHGKWTSLTLWGFGPVQRVWGHSMGWKKSVVPLLLICFDLFFNLGVPPNEGFQSRSLGRGDRTTRSG